jgi:hypothetical protein
MTLNRHTLSQKPMPSLPGARALSLESTISVGLPATTHGDHQIRCRRLSTTVIPSVRSNFLQRYIQLDLALDSNDLAGLNGFNVREPDGQAWQEVFQTIRSRDMETAGEKQDF